MTQPRRILWLSVVAAAVALLPLRAAAQSGTVTDDAFLSSNSTTQKLNLGGQGISLIVPGSSAMAGSPLVRVGQTTTYIKFQLQSSLPQNIAAANVEKATLKLFLSPSSAPSGAIDIYPVTSAWTESTLSSSSSPTLAAAHFASNIPVGNDLSFLVVDLTQLVQECQGNTVANDGIALVAHTSSSYAVFYSNEGVVTSHEPRLEIVLANTGPAGAAATVQVGTTTTVGAGGQAAVTNSGTPNAAILNFAIPQRQPGATGQTGPPGAPGAAATVQVGTTMTVPAGTPASVLNGGTASAAVLNFLIPQGPRLDSPARKVRKVRKGRLGSTTGASGPPRWRTVPTMGCSTLRRIGWRPRQTRVRSHRQRIRTGSFWPTVSSIAALGVPPTATT